MPQTFSQAEQKLVLDLDRVDWNFISEWARRGDSRLIDTRPAPDASLYEYRALAYGVVSCAFGDIQHTANTEGLSAALDALRVLRRSSAMAIWAGLLGHDIGELCDAVAVRLTRGTVLLFEPADGDGAKPTARPYPPKTTYQNKRKVAA